MTEYDIIHTRGDSYIQNYTFKDTDWTPINLHWASIKMTIKTNINDTSALLSSDFVIINESLWTAKVSFTPTQMKLDLKSYYYDVQFIDSIWTITTLLKWAFIITYEITT